jgi:hypothetical protein
MKARPIVWLAGAVVLIQIVWIGIALFANNDTRSDIKALVVGYIQRPGVPTRMCVVANDRQIRYIGQVSIKTGCYIMDASLASDPPAVGTCNDLKLALLRRSGDVTAKFVAVSKEPCDVPPEESTCFFDYFQRSKSPIGIPAAGSPDWYSPVCGPPPS